MQITNNHYYTEKLLQALEKQHETQQRMIVELTKLKDQTIAGLASVEQAIRSANGRREKNLWRLIMILVGALLLSLGLDISKIGIF